MPVTPKTINNFVDFSKNNVSLVSFPFQDSNDFFVKNISLFTSLTINESSIINTKSVFVFDLNQFLVENFFNMFFYGCSYKNTYYSTGILFSFGLFVKYLYQNNNDFSLVLYYKESDLLDSLKTLVNDEEANNLNKTIKGYVPSLLSIFCSFPNAYIAFGKNEANRREFIDYVESLKKSCEGAINVIDDSPLTSVIYNTGLNQYYFFYGGGLKLIKKNHFRVKYKMNYKSFVVYKSLVGDYRYGLVDLRNSLNTSDDNLRFFSNSVQEHGFLETVKYLEVKEEYIYSRFRKALSKIKKNMGKVLYKEEDYDNPELFVIEDVDNSLFDKFQLFSIGRFYYENERGFTTPPN